MQAAPGNLIDLKRAIVENLIQSRGQSLNGTYTSETRDHSMPMRRHAPLDATDIEDHRSPIRTAAATKTAKTLRAAGTARSAEASSAKPSSAVDPAYTAATRTTKPLSTVDPNVVHTRIDTSAAKTTSTATPLPTMFASSSSPSPNMDRRPQPSKATLGARKAVPPVDIGGSSSTTINSDAYLASRSASASGSSPHQQSSRWPSATQNLSTSDPFPSDVGEEDEYEYDEYMTSSRSPALPPTVPVKPYPPQLPHAAALSPISLMHDTLNTPSRLSNASPSSIASSSKLPPANFTLSDPQFFPKKYRNAKNASSRPTSAMSTSTAHSARAAVVHTASRQVLQKSTAKKASPAQSMLDHGGGSTAKTGTFPQGAGDWDQEGEEGGMTDDEYNRFHMRDSVVTEDSDYEPEPLQHSQAQNLPNGSRRNPSIQQDGQRLIYGTPANSKIGFMRTSPTPRQQQGSWSSPVLLQSSPKDTRQAPILSTSETSSTLSLTGREPQIPSPSRGPRKIVVSGQDDPQTASSSGGFSVSTIAPNAYLDVDGGGLYLQQEDQPHPGEWASADSVTSASGLYSPNEDSAAAEDPNLAKLAAFSFPQLPRTNGVPNDGSTSTSQTTTPRARWDDAIREVQRREREKNSVALGRPSAASISGSADHLRALSAVSATSMATSDKPGQSSILGLTGMSNAPIATSKEDLLSSLLTSQATAEAATSFTTQPFDSVEELEAAKRELKRLESRLVDKKNKLRTTRRLRGAAGKLARADRDRAPSKSASNSISPSASLRGALSANTSVPATRKNSSSYSPLKPPAHQYSLSNASSVSTAIGGYSSAVEGVETAAEQVDKIVEEVFAIQDRIEGLRVRIREHVARTLAQRCATLEEASSARRGVVFLRSQESSDHVDAGVAHSAVIKTSNRASEPDEAMVEELQSLRQQVAHLENQHQVASSQGEELAQLRRQVEDLRSQHSSASTQHQELQQHNAMLTRELQDHQVKAEQSETEVSSLSARSHQARQDAQAAQLELMNAQQELEQYRRDAQQAAQANRMMSEQETEEKIQAVQAELANARHIAEQKMNALANELANAQQDSQQQVRALQAELASLQRDSEQEIESLQVELAKTQQDLEQHQLKARRDAEHANSSSQRELSALQNRFASVESHLQQEQATKAALQHQLDSVSARAESAEADISVHAAAAQDARGEVEALELAVSAERRIMAERDSLFQAFEARLKRAEQTLRDQDKRCAALLGKSEGREQLDDFLARIRGGAAKKADKTAGQDIDDLLSSLGEHIADLAHEVSRRRRGGRGASGPRGDGDDFGMDEEDEDHDSRGEQDALIADLEDQLEDARQELIRLRGENESNRIQIEALNASIAQPNGTSRAVSARLGRDRGNEDQDAAVSEAKLADLKKQNAQLAEEVSSLKAAAARATSKSASRDESFEDEHSSVVNKVAGSDHEPDSPVKRNVGSRVQALAQSFASGTAKAVGNNYGPPGQLRSSSEKTLTALLEVLPSGLDERVAQASDVKALEEALGQKAPRGVGGTSSEAIVLQRAKLLLLAAQSVTAKVVALQEAKAAADAKVAFAQHLSQRSSGDTVSSHSLLTPSGESKIQAEMDAFFSSMSIGGDAGSRSGSISVADSRLTTPTSLGGSVGPRQQAPSMLRSVSSSASRGSGMGKRRYIKALNTSAPFLPDSSSSHQGRGDDGEEMSPATISPTESSPLGWLSKNGCGSSTARTPTSSLSPLKLSRSITDPRNGSSPAHDHLDIPLPPSGLQSHSPSSSKTMLRSASAQSPYKADPALGGGMAPQRSLALSSSTSQLLSHIRQLESQVHQLTSLRSSSTSRVASLEEALKGKEAEAESLKEELTRVRERMGEEGAKLLEEVNRLQLQSKGTSVGDAAGTAATAPVTVPTTSTGTSFLSSLGLGLSIPTSSVSPAISTKSLAPPSPTPAAVPTSPMALQSISLLTPNSGTVALPGEKTSTSPVPSAAPMTIERSRSPGGKLLGGWFGKAGPSSAAPAAPATASSAEPAMTVIEL